MKKIDLSAQILKKINRASTPQFKTINDVDKVSQYNMLQYAIFLTKYGDMHNLNNDEYLYLLENMEFGPRGTRQTNYKPDVTMDLIFGVRQNQKLTFSVDFLEKLHHFHNTSPLFYSIERPTVKSMLTRSLLDFPDIEVESWLWLVKKNMMNDKNPANSADAVKEYLLKFCDTAMRHLSFPYEENMIHAQKSIAYLTAIKDQQNLEDNIASVAKTSSELGVKPKVVKI